MAAKKTEVSGLQRRVIFDLPDKASKLELDTRDGLPSTLPKEQPSTMAPKSVASSTAPYLKLDTGTKETVPTIKSKHPSHQATEGRVRASSDALDGVNVVSRPPPPPTTDIPPQKRNEDRRPSDNTAPLTKNIPPPPDHFPAPPGSLTPLLLPRPVQHKPSPTPSLNGDVWTKGTTTVSAALLDGTGSGIFHPEGLIERWKRLTALREKVLSFRSEVTLSRQKAREQLGRARMADGKVQDARAEAEGATTGLFHTMGGWSVKSAIQTRIKDLEHRAQAAWKASRVFDKELDRAEARLSILERKMHSEESKMFGALETSMVLRSAADEQSYGSEVMEDDPPTAGIRDSDSDDLAPELRFYFDAVAEINILRERLVELETNYRDQLKVGFESATMKSAIPLGREVLDVYHLSRAKTVHRLLYLRLRAEALWNEHEQDLLEDLEGPTLPPHEEALKYNVGGDLGAMYSFHYEAYHWGIRPIELRLVPYEHVEDYVARWLLQTELAGREEIEEMTDPDFVYDENDAGLPMFDDDGALAPSSYHMSRPQPLEARFAEGRDPKQRSDPGCRCCYEGGPRHDPVVLSTFKILKKTRSWDERLDMNPDKFEASRRLLIRSLLLLKQVPDF